MDFDWIKAINYYWEACVMRITGDDRFLSITNRMLAAGILNQPDLISERDQKLASLGGFLELARQLLCDQARGGAELVLYEASKEKTLSELSKIKAEIISEFGQEYFNNIERAVKRMFAVMFLGEEIILQIAERMQRASILVVGEGNVYSRVLAYNEGTRQRYTAELDAYLDEFISLQPHKAAISAAA